MVAAAERDGVTRVAVVPVGFHYTRGAKWTIRARIGAALTGTQIDAIEATVRELSRQ
jgi:sirohydrochlorin ferrochelatase